MSISMNVGNLAFGSKKAAKDYVRDMLETYDYFSVLSDSDRAFVLDLLYLHPQYECRLGCNISSVYVDGDHKSNREKSLHIVWMDGSETEFDWEACIDGHNDRYAALEAFRVAVVDHVEAFKQLASGKQRLCPVTRKAITPANSQVDHQAPKTFNWLVCMFLKEHGLALSDVGVAKKGNQAHLQDLDLHKRWCCFYKKKAPLRLVHADALYQK